jgi:hypothetical protein
VNHTVWIVSGATRSASAPPSVSIRITGEPGAGQMNLCVVSDDPHRHLQAPVRQRKVVLHVARIFKPFPTCVSVQLNVFGIRKCVNPIAQGLRTPAGRRAGGGMAATKRLIIRGIGEISPVSRTWRLNGEPELFRQVVLKHKIKRFRLLLACGIFDSYIVLLAWSHVDG